MTNGSQGKTILIVEDDEDILSDLNELLTGEGYNVLCAENGQIAFNLLHSLKVLPSVVLLDIMMPVMDGWQFRILQTQEPKFARIPIVVMTADGQAPQKAAKMNAPGYVQKPIDVEKLLATIIRVAP